VAKTGFSTLTRTAAAAEVANGITVNMVSPGLMRGGALPQGGTSPNPRSARFEDVAEAVAFCASDRAAACHRGQPHRRRHVEDVREGQNHRLQLRMNICSAWFLRPNWC